MIKSRIARLIAILAVTSAATALISGCRSSSSTANEKPGHDFDQASEQFLQAFWPVFPTWSTRAGLHQYDHIQPIPNQASRTKKLAFAAKYKALMQQFNVAKLNEQQKTDYYLIINKLDNIQWSINVQKSHQWDPSDYNVARGFARIINGSHDSLENRLRSALQRLQNVPQYYQAAIDNITIPTLEHTELAISQNQGALSLFSDKLLDQVASSSLTPSEKSLFTERVQAARQAINQFVGQLEQRLAQLKQQGNARSFRLGKTLYQQKFALSIQSQYSAREIFDKALADKTTVLGEMTKLTRQLWPKYLPNTTQPASDSAATAMLINHISVKHVKREDFVSEIRRQIPALEKFIIDKNLIDVDPKKPLVIRETPLYMRGIAGASVSSPGPFDKHANTYYNVTPLDSMNETQAESYLREYNHWLLQILNIHEAIPGHYTQLVYANNSPSLIKSVFGNGAMIEGWAVYAERMMLEQGYGDFEPELWLMYYKWNLRVIANMILDYSVHNLNMTKAQAMDLLVNQVFQEQTEAQGKWRRVTLSQVQLGSYYSGFREIYDFRTEMQAKQGANFDLKAFHEKFLSYGSAPVKYIKQLMR